MNTITVIGNIGKDPESRVTAKGKPVVTFSVADNKKLPGTSGKSKEDWTSQWWYCTAFKELAEAIVQDVKRGDRVEVTGKIDMHEYTAKDGTQKVAYNLLVNRIAKVVRPMRANNGGFNNMGSEVADEEIPFDRYYGLFLCATFAYASMSMVRDFAERFVIVVNYFVG